MGIFYKIFFSFTLFFLVPFTVSAASFNFYPPSGSYGTGKIFSVNVNVESNDQTINAASGVVSFPPDRLEVVSVSKQGSIFSLWPTEPSFSNSQGTVSFEGIVPNPGYIGTNGKVLAITFKARGSGSANISFSSGLVLANDGAGTDVLDGPSVAVYTLSNEVLTVNSNALKISSLTHFDQEKWYISNDVEFSWELPDGALEVITGIGRSASVVPSVSYIKLISKKKVENIPDGINYFAVQVRTINGWGPVSRFRVNIDKTPPKPFSITFPHGAKGLDPQPVVLFNTADNESGISHYEVKVGNDGEPLRNAPQALSNPYVLPARAPGNYKLLVTAIDNAGNTESASAEYSIEGIDAPNITYYPGAIEEGDLLKIRGTTYPDSDVTIYVREGDALVSEEYTRSNSLGDFATVVAKRLDAGVYNFTARIKDSRGAESRESSPITVSVRSVFFSGMLGSILKYVFGITLIIITLCVAGLACVWLRNIYRKLTEK